MKSFMMQQTITKLHWHLERLVKCNEKEVVLVIVEGPSDEEALGAILSRYFDENEVRVYVRRGDITTEKGNKCSNIISKVNECVKQHMALYSLRRTDYKEIIQVADMDGAFIPDDAIVEDKDAYKPIYSEKEIHTNHPEGIMKRNAQKRENMNRLITTSAIGKIPYHIYYMSSNLDHVLYNKLNSTNDEKENDAHNFAEKYKDDLNGFKAFIRESDFSVIKDFMDSWDYIKQGNHSLERHTNFGLCLEKGENTQEEKQ